LPLSTDDHPPVIRKAFESITEMQTALIQLSPGFFSALQSVAPKKRRGQVRYVIIGALLVVVCAILADRSARSFLVERARAVFVKAPATSDAPPNALPAAAPTAPVVVAPAVAPVTPDTAAAPATVAPVNVTKPSAPAVPDAKPTKDARPPAAAPAKRNTRIKSTRAPRPAARPQPAGAPVALAARDGF
jgi:hypothetical protein